MFPIGYHTPHKTVAALPRITLTLADVTMRIVLYGDSMTEYLHTPPRVLAGMLQAQNPGRAFEILNYGVGATRAELVLYRLRYEFWHGRQRMLPLPVLKPDALVLESYAFNNSNDQAAGLENFTRIWDEILETCRELAPHSRLICLVTIASTPQPPGEMANRLFFHAGPEIFANRHHWREIYQERFIEWATRRRVDLVNVRKDVQSAAAAGTPPTHWIAADGVHPNPAGVEKISAAIADKITSHILTHTETI